MLHVNKNNFYPLLSQLRLVGSHNKFGGGSSRRLGIVRVAIWEVLFFYTPFRVGCIFEGKVPIETFHISSESTHNKQQAGIKSI